jgi:hypothetical protein
MSPRPGIPLAVPRRVCYILDMATVTADRFLRTRADELRAPRPPSCNGEGGRWRFRCPLRAARPV